MNVLDKFSSGNVTNNTKKAQELKTLGFVDLLTSVISGFHFLTEKRTFFNTDPEQLKSKSYEHRH